VPSKRTGSNVNDNATAPPSRRKASFPCPLPNRARFRARRRLGRRCRRMGHRPCFWVLPPLNSRNRVDGSLATLLRRECNGGMVGRTERVERLRDKRGGSPCFRFSCRWTSCYAVFRHFMVGLQASRLRLLRMRWLQKGCRSKAQLRPPPPGLILRQCNNPDMRSAHFKVNGGTALCNNDQVCEIKA
jgi:hypothetical protein